ncbi:MULTISPECIES: iron-hydroxamate ABC transporter substrate-binding protein [Bacillus cereus group]|uniref:iron-hydroxamate ABC transporter substrate-binding protein n=1 Tax=Bacillus cereus group TaxID=86661 RepID=UPI0011F0408B|nr:MULTISPECIES: iron-hydroxamate ABC transporter substrate-binding protein [Bacillus cereus group]MBJ8018257.1 iron-hydroxamate ABC transporter substrate-binding protein [Bacillus cereus group sp. N34]QEL83248.1 ABC transporter substrate-binding protein [Bacillus mycoides]QWH48750.1 iron-hydroxamate ABC transporter substrate-binding protein [Bacillus mycoides]QWJ00864.1 iron-hydroxamate ABC transporter substrate-binding protein [Bacillus mycoides]
MKKLFISLTVLFVLVMSACSNGSTDKKNDAKGKKSETITYQSENGKVEVPANPQRVVVLSSFAGNVMSLGVNLVGVDSWSKQNSRFDSKLKNVAEVSDENVEKIAELNPDLIIGLSNIKNVDKLKKIAPTVTYTYGKVDYLTQHLEIGKLLNKEKEAKTWVDDFKKRAQTAGKDIKAKIGEDATVSVVENFNKQLYVYGENWGRGTEILYQEMKLKMPEKVKEKALKEGYYALSTEVLPEFAGDYLIVSKNKDTDNSFQETESYKNIPAVKNNRVYEANMMEFYFNDPLTLDFQLDFFKKSFLGQ